MSRLLRLKIALVLMLLALCHAATADVGKRQKEAYAMFTLGEESYSDKLYSSAMKSYLDALRIAEHDGYNEITARVYNGIGNLYSTQGDYQMGVYFYRKALAMSKYTGHKVLQNAILNNLVGAACFIGQVDSSIVYLRQLELNKVKTPDYKYNILMGRGLIAKSQGHSGEAAGCYIMAREYAKVHHMDFSYIDTSNSCLAMLYMDTGHPDSAIFLLRKNEAWARSTHQSDQLAETLHQLAMAYDAKGNATIASACRMEYVNLIDSIHHSDEFNAMKNEQFLYDAKKNASKINMLTKQQSFNEQQIRMQNRWLVTLATGFVVIAMLLVVAYVQKRQLRQAYDKLYDQSLLTLANDSGDDSNNHTTASILTDSQRSSLLDNIHRVMELPEEFCRPDFSIDRLAQLVNSNQRYVSEAINDGYGKNFRTFLNEYRIKEAMQRLADVEHYGGYTIKAISESVGYKSQANFITVFTKLTGMKPSMYQKISKERR